MLKQESHFMRFGWRKPYESRGSCTVLRGAGVKLPGLLTYAAGYFHLKYMVTKNSGITWEKVMDGLPSKWVSRIIASQYDEATVYFALNGDIETTISPHTSTDQPITARPGKTSRTTCAAVRSMLSKRIPRGRTYSIAEQTWVFMFHWIRAKPGILCVRICRQPLFMTWLSTHGMISLLSVRTAAVLM